jgi:hypothetical protein
MTYYCDNCDKYYKSYKSKWEHDKNFHRNEKDKEKVKKIMDSDCSKCGKKLSNYFSKWRHEKKCKSIIKLKDQDIIKQKNNEIQLQKEKINDLEQKIENLINKNSIINDLKTIKKYSKINKPVNDKLKKMVIKENKQIINSDSELSEILKEKNIIVEKLIYNNIEIIRRDVDNYIDIFSMSKAGEKDFDDWYKLNTTNEIIKNFSEEVNIKKFTLIEDKKWIHPTLAIQYAQWISPFFGLKISDWINKNKLNIITIKKAEKRIKILENLILRKQKRETFDNKNFIYIITNNFIKKERIYIVGTGFALLRFPKENGKAKSMENRLSTYNKSSEHEITYCRSCETEDDMNNIEIIFLSKIKQYREKANRDRFIQTMINSVYVFQHYYVYQMNL